ncbi:MAG: response regulator transcription factor [Syntrophomonadaceae bacterium]|nr:response regulator transcription factor [Syntrophomonadaceae bacterium]
MINALILEDEEYNRDFIRQILSVIPEITNIFTTSSGEEAYAWAKENQPQIALLDIELAGQTANGLDVARGIDQLNNDMYIVFVTGYSKYAVESFDVHPYGYVLKPIRISQFKELIEEIVCRLEQVKQKPSGVLTIRVKNEMIHINHSDIIFIEAGNHKTIIHSLEAIWEVRKGLDEVKNILGADFVRVHRSFVVNMTKIKKTRETYDRSYEIEFWDYPETALMSRYYYPKYKDFFRV